MVVGGWCGGVGWLGFLGRREKEKGEIWGWGELSFFAITSLVVLSSCLSIETTFLALMLCIKYELTGVVLESCF